MAVAFTVAACKQDEEKGELDGTWTGAVGISEEQQNLPAKLVCSGENWTMQVEIDSVYQNLSKGTYSGSGSTFTFVETHGVKDIGGAWFAKGQQISMPATLSGNVLTIADEQSGAMAFAKSK